MSTATPPQPRTDDEIARLFACVDNSGRWGENDELGTLNHITEAKRVEAAGLVRAGRVVSLAHPLRPDDTPTAKVEIELEMMINLRAREPHGVPPAAADAIRFQSHQQGVTHLDALAHIGSHDGRVHGGRPFDEAVAEDGIRFGSIYAQRHGIFSRGVLLDLPAAEGCDWIQPGTEILPRHLEAAERHGGVEVVTGDVVVVRSGHGAYEKTHGPSPLVAGPGPAAAAWMHEREVAVYTGDAPDHITMTGALILGRIPPSEVDPRELTKTRFPLPFHQIAIPAVGLCLLDHAEVEELARVCRELGRHEFLFIAAPLPIPGASGSPVNPLAVF